MSAIPPVLPDAPWRHRDGLAELCAALGAAEGEARFVGGAVRDSLLAHPVKDVDIATIHLPQTVIERIKAAGFKAVPTGLAHGTVTAVLHGWPVEITTLRRDVATDGRRATVAFATDWEEDAARRDFTINALYADPQTGKIDDYFGGLADLEQAQVRFIGDPIARIDEDHLRILRYFRFTARFGTLDRSSADYAACVVRATSLMALSRERIADELLKLLALPDPADALAAMVADGILAPVLPEIKAEGVAALRALLVTEQAVGVAPDALRRLIALLPADAALADQIGARLRLSKKTRARLVTASSAVAAPTPEASVYLVGVASTMDRMLLGRAFTSDAVQTITNWTPPRLPLSGGDLIAMGLMAGPVVAQTLQELERQWLAAGFPDAKQTRVLAAQLVAGVLRASQ